MTRPALLALLLAAGPVAAAPIPRPAAVPTPTVTAQALPAGDLLDRLIGFARLVAGEAAADTLHGKIKEALGTKGLDPARPAAGYAYLTPNLEESWFVLVLPVTGEDDFKDFLARMIPNDPLHLIPVKDNPGLFRVEGTHGDNPTPVRVRYGDKYAYFAVNAKDDALDPKNLVPVGKLIDPAETAPVAARLALDNLDPAVRRQAIELIDMGIAEAGRPPRFPRGVNWGQLFGLPLLKEAKKYATRVDQDGDRLTARLVADPKAADLALDLALTAKKGTALEKDIAAFPAPENRFAGIFPADALGGGVMRVPTFSPDLRDAAVALAEALTADAVRDAPAPVKPVAGAVGAAAGRTLKNGHLDLGGAFLGPDKDGLHTAVAAVALDDPADVEKALREAVKNAPPPVRAAVTFDAETAGGLSVHTVAAGGLMTPGQRKVFGEKATAYLAFGPKAVYAALGPAGPAELKRVIALKPGPAPVMDFRANLKRVMALAGEPQRIAPDDRLLPLQLIDVRGGPELRVKVSPVYMFMGMVMFTRF